jgi:hypothetical protein
MKRWKIALHFEVDADTDDDAFHAGEDLAATIEAPHEAEYGGTVVLGEVELRPIPRIMSKADSERLDAGPAIHPSRTRKAEQHHHDRHSRHFPMAECNQPECRQAAKKASNDR